MLGKMLLRSYFSSCDLTSLQMFLFFIHNCVIFPSPVLWEIFQLLQHFISLCKQTQAFVCFHLYTRVGFTGVWLTGLMGTAVNGALITDSDVKAPILLFHSSTSSTSPFLSVTSSHSSFLLFSIHLTPLYDYSFAPSSFMKKWCAG